MKKLLYVLLVFPFVAFGQNLVPNGSFEDTVSCPNGVSQLTEAQYWINPTIATPDYLNYCSNFAIPGLFGYQFPHFGNAYAGIAIGSPLSNYREYVEVPLNTPLIAGNCYQLSFYASSADIFKYSTDALQGYFSDSLIFGVISNVYLPVVPQVVNANGNFLDTLNWTLVQGEFVANGSESHLIIGNFLDKNLCTWVQVNNTGTNNGYAYIDDVSLIEVFCTGLPQYDEYTFTTYPNPANDILTLSTNSNDSFEIIIYNLFSQSCLRKEFSKSTIMNLSNFNNGIYTYSIFHKNELKYRGKIVKVN